MAKSVAMSKVLPTLALVVAVAVLILVTRDETGFDPESLYFLDPIKVEDAPQSVSVGEGGVWVTNGGSATVSRIDPTDAKVVGEPIQVDAIPNGLAAGEGSVWVGFGEASTSISRIDPDSGKVTDRIEVGRAPSSIATGYGSVWVAAIVGDVVVRLDPNTGELRGRLGKKELEFPSTVEVGLGSAWVADVVSDEVLRLDPRTLRVEDRVKVGVSPTAIALGEDAAWVANFDETITRIDAETLATTSIAIDGKPGDVVAGGGFVWVTVPDRAVVLRISPSSRKVVGAPIPVGKSPQGIAYGNGDVWVANQGNDTVTRIDLDPE